MAFEDIRPKKDWYSILGAESSDSLKELKRKYQRLILLHHPDKQSTDVPAGEAEARRQRFIEIDQAWKILGNEETKKEYDLQRRVLYTSIPQLHLLKLVGKPKSTLRLTNNKRLYRSNLNQGPHHVPFPNITKVLGQLLTRSLAFGADQCSKPCHSAG